VLANYAKLSAAMPSITHTRQSLDRSPAHHCLRASRIGRPSLHCRSWPGLYARNFSAKSAGTWHWRGPISTPSCLRTFTWTTPAPPARWSGENPRLAVHVHKNGAPHVIDPSKLLASAPAPLAQRLAATCSEKLFPLPVEKSAHPRRRRNTYARLAQTRSRPIHRATHRIHVSYFDQAEGIAFVGDTAGVRIEGIPTAMPATPSARTSIWRSGITPSPPSWSAKPLRLFLTHYGYSDNPPSTFWFIPASGCIAGPRWLWRRCATPPAIPPRWIRFMSATFAEISQHLPAGEAEHYAFSAGLNLSFLGLARYLRKRAHCRFVNCA